MWERGGGGGVRPIVVGPLKISYFLLNCFSISCIHLIFYVLYLSCLCLVYLMSLSCLCHVYLMSLSCLSLVYLMSLSCLCFVYVLSMSCQCNVYIMAFGERHTEYRKPDVRTESFIEKIRYIVKLITFATVYSLYFSWDHDLAILVKDQEIFRPYY